MVFTADLFKAVFTSKIVTSFNCISKTVKNRIPEKAYYVNKNGKIGQCVDYLFKITVILHLRKFFYIISSVIK